MTLYDFPLLGEWLLRGRRREGAHIASLLRGRGYPCGDILRYSLGGLRQAAAEHNRRDLHLYLGMATKARQMRDEATCLQAEEG